MDRISIIVSTYKRKEKLKRLLESFSKLRCCCPLEFIIVDNCSDDGTASIIENWKKTIDFADVKFTILTARSPLVHSRNVGISLSTGNIIAFTDDDCLVDPGWVDYLYQRLISCSEYVGVGGRVLPLGDDIFSTYSTVYHSLEPPSHINAIVTANCIFWKQPVVDVGQFDDYFIVPGAEDTAISMKLWLRGYRFGFEERAIVYHNYRQSLGEFAKTFYNCGNGEKLIIENRLKEYLQYMQYPEQIYNYIAFRNLFQFQVLFILRMVFGVFRQFSLLGDTQIPPPKRVMLVGLYALHQFCHHQARGTFSGVLPKTVEKSLAKHPESLLTLSPGTDSKSPLLEITDDTIPPVFKPGQKKKTSITIKNQRPDLWLSAEFLIVLQNIEEHFTFYKTQKLQNMIFFPGTESVYALTIKAPTEERDYIVQVYLMTPEGIPLSGKREKIIRVSSKTPDPAIKNN